MILALRKFVFLIIISLLLIPASVVAADMCKCFGNFSLDKAGQETLKISSGGTFDAAAFNIACAAAGNGFGVVGNFACGVDVTYNFAGSDFGCNENFVIGSFNPDLGRLGEFNGQCNLVKADGSAQPSAVPGDKSEDKSAEGSQEKKATDKYCPEGVTDRICLENPLNGEKKKAGEIIQNVITGALGIVGALALLMLVLGGFKWLTSAGKAEKVEEGTKTMVWAVIGLFLVFASYILLNTFTSLLTTGGAPK